MGWLDFIFRRAPRASKPRPIRGSRPAPGVVSSVNALRSSMRLPALAWDDRLGDAALRHAKDQAIFSTMSHRGSDGSELDDRAMAAGYPSPAGECVAAGGFGEGDAVADWFADEPHRRILLARDARSAGAAVAFDYDGRPFWCLVTGRS